MSWRRPPLEFTDGVYQVVRGIPPGRVMTYGQIAALLPPPAGTDVLAYERVRARWVGYALAACPDDVPWQRVVNAAGRISPRPDEGPELQRLLLLEEGVVFDRAGRIDLALFGWDPRGDRHDSNAARQTPSGDLDGGGRRQGRQVPRRNA